MVYPFNVPFNIPKGTAVADGFRVAPDFNSLASAQVDANGNLLSGSSYNNCGKGMLVSPNVTMNITPFATTAGNIVAQNPVLAQRWLQLAQDGGATTLVSTTNQNMFPKGAVVNGQNVPAPNQQYLQLDYPRVPQVIVAGTADLIAPQNITIFGQDQYGNPMQHTYTLQARGTYPRAIYNTPPGGYPTPLAIRAKAFYRITGIYYNGATTANTNITIQTTNWFGLPFALKTYSDVNLFRWNNTDMLTQGGVAQLAADTRNVVTPVAQAIIDAQAATITNGNAYAAPQVTLARLQAAGALGELTIGQSGVAPITPVPSSVGAQAFFTIASNGGGETSKISWSMPNAGYYLMQTADRGVAPLLTTNAYAGDVRGLIQLPNLAETWGTPPDGSTKLIFSYYCEGFDQQLNILNAGQQPQLNGILYKFPDGTSNNITPPNTLEDMYGVPQYYTGAWA